MEDSKPGQTRRRLSEQAWRAVLGRFDGAAMTVQEFCLREGLTRSSFIRWRARLRSSLRQVAALEVAPAPKPGPADPPKPSFVDLGLLGGASAALDLRIELGGGISLHLVRR